MSLVTLSELVFAAAVVLASVALTAAGFRLAGRGLLVALTGLVVMLAVADWVVFALRPGREIAVGAGGATLAGFATAAALALARALRRVAQVDVEIEREHDELRAFVARAKEEQRVELDRVLSRARADSISALTEQERRIADERRALVAERERSAATALADALAQTQAQVELRLPEWAQDLERSAEAMRRRIADVGQRQKQLLAETEARITADAERLQAQSEEQREAVVRLRGEL